MAIPAITGIALPAAPAVPAAPVGPAADKGFGGVLANLIGKVDQAQQTATTASQQLASGQATDISTVAMEVEQASLSLQLAVQVRNKVVDAYQELFRMQI